MLNQVVGAFGLSVVGSVAYSVYKEFNNDYENNVCKLLDLKDYKNDVLKPYRSDLPEMLRKVKLPLNWIYAAGAGLGFASLLKNSLDAFLGGNSHFAAIAVSATVLAVCAGELINLYEGKNGYKFGAQGLNITRNFTRSTCKFLNSFLYNDSDTSLKSVRVIA